MMDITDLQALPEIEPMETELPGLQTQPCTVTCSTSCTYTCGSLSCGRTAVSPK